MSGAWRKLRLELQSVGKDLALKPYKKAKNVTAWISDDANRHFIKFTADLRMGTVFVELEMVRGSGGVFAAGGVRGVVASFFERKGEAVTPPELPAARTPPLRGTLVGKGRRNVIAEAWQSCLKGPRIYGLAQIGSHEWVLICVICGRFFAPPARDEISEHLFIFFASMFSALP